MKPKSHAELTMLLNHLAQSVIALTREVKQLTENQELLMKYAHRHPEDQNVTAQERISDQNR